MSKQVADVMTPGAATVRLADTVTEAARTMREHDVGAIPVVDDGMLVGIVTDRDIAVRVVAEGRDPNTMRAAEAASPDLVVVHPEQSLDDATELMGARQVRRLPVVDDTGRLVGMLAQADIALGERPKIAGHLLEEISQPRSIVRA
jgi:CBS domain-containing protein